MIQVLYCRYSDELLYTECVILVVMFVKFVKKIFPHLILSNFIILQMYFGVVTVIFVVMGIFVDLSP